MIINFDQPEKLYPKSICHINQTALNNVKTFKYLGSIFKYDQLSTGDEEMTNRMNLAQNKFAAMKNLFTNHHIHLPIRLQFFNSFIRSRLTYSCQTWTLTKTQLTKINSTYCRLLRRMIKGGFDRKTNDDQTFEFKFNNCKILKICNTDHIEAYINKQREKFLGHIIRQPNFRHIKQLTFNCNTGVASGKFSKSMMQQVIDVRQIDIIQFCKEAMLRLF